MPNVRRQPVKLALLTAALMSLTSGAMAAGLGRLTVLSAIGEPLAAEIELSASPDELVSLAARLASPEDFQKHGIEFHPALASVRVMLDKRPDGRPFLRLFSDRPFNEPFLDVLVELSWASGRVKREYTALLDPPAALRRPPAVEAPVAAPSLAPQVAPPSSLPVAGSPGEPIKPESTPAVPAKPAPAAPVKPAKPAGQQAAVQLAEESTGRLVKPGETLALIAKEVKPEGVSLEQMLVALLRHNREAFVAENMNRLKAGRILRLPTAEEASAIDPAEARRIVIAQANDFNAYRQKLASAVAAESARPEAARQEASGRITPRVEEKLPPPAGRDKLEVSPTEQARAAEASKRIAALEEDLVARDKALKEANERVAMLEKNLADLQKLVELKSQAGAQMQAQAAATQPPVKAEEAPLKTAETMSVPPAEPPKAAEPTAANEAGQAATKLSPAETAQPASPPAPAQPAPAASAPPKTPPPPPEPSFWQENLLSLAAAGGAIAGLLGFLAYRVWQRRKAAAESASSEMASVMTTGGDLPTASGQSSESEGPSIQTDFGPGAAGIDADEGVDPVAEADVYMAYGRDAQAEEILLEALKNDPARLAIHLKLLELYAQRHDARKFETVARDLYGLTAGTGEEWAKAAAMGRALEPSNPLYGGGEASSSALDATVIVPPDEAATLAAAASASSELAHTAAASADVALTSPEATEAPEMVSLEFDLGTPAPEATNTPEPEKAAEEVMSLDFELDLTAPTAETSPPTATPPAEEVASLDFDLGLAEPAAVEPELAPVFEEQPATSAPMPEPSSSADLDFELELPKLEEPGTTEAPASPSLTPPPLDLSGISLDLELPAEESPAASAAPIAEEPLPDADDKPEIATKLELALAYEEMGDKEGARELLEEVLRDGSPKQQQIARSRLARLDA